MTKQLLGTGVALVTPFNQDKSIDFDSLKRLVDFVITGGVEYLVVMGTTAESATLSKTEKDLVIACIKTQNNKRVPMVIGIGGNNTAEVVTAIEETDLTDFIAILSVSPYYNKPTQEGIYQHYKAIASSTAANIILYNVPGRTNSNISPEVTVRLANEFKNIVALKEASPVFLQSLEVIKDTPEGFMVISGDDDYTLPMTMMGGAGVISVIGQGIPKEYSEMTRLGLKLDLKSALKLHYQAMDITQMIFEEGNPAGIKALLSLRGICKPYVRLPLVEASEILTQKIKNELINFN